MSLLEKIPLIEIKEGLARILVPDPSKYRRPDGIYEPAWAPVFYNPKMKENRDMAVLALVAHLKLTSRREAIVADILGGTGVRGIRFALEVPYVFKAYVNDKNPLAYELTVKNVRLNDLEERVVVENFDANLMLQIHRFSSEFFDYIDIDPFGSPVEFIDSSIMTIKIGGMLGVTATDTAALEGTYPHACIRKYFSKPLRADFSKEMAIRILIANLAYRAAAYEYGLNVKLGYYSQYYVRAYVTLEKGSKKALDTLENVGYVVFNARTGEYKLVKSIADLAKTAKNEENTVIGGPLWLGVLADKRFVGKMIEELKEREYFENKASLMNLLQTIIKEADLPPLYYRVDFLGKRLRKTIPPMKKLLECIRSEGYEAVRPHMDNLGFKTNAPYDVVVKCFSKN